MADWRERAACIEHDPDLFFPNGNTRPDKALAARAAAVCAICPVVADCRRDALVTPRTVGVWGGELFRQSLTETKRAEMARKMLATN